jgi:hypothetical protein
MTMSYRVLAGSMVAAGATALALLIHRTIPVCAHLIAQPGSGCAAQATDYPLHLRIGILVAGLIVASLIVILGGVRRNRGQGRRSAVGTSS